MTALDRKADMDQQVNQRLLGAHQSPKPDSPQGPTLPPFKHQQSDVRFRVIGKGAGMAEIGREAELRVRRSAAQSPGLLAAIVRKHGTQRVKSSSCRDWRC